MGVADTTIPFLGSTSNVLFRYANLMVPSEHLSMRGRDFKSFQQIITCELSASVAKKAAVSRPVALTTTTADSTTVAYVRLRRPHRIVACSHQEQPRTQQHSIRTIVSCNARAKIIVSCDRLRLSRRLPIPSRPPHTTLPTIALFPPFIPDYVSTIEQMCAWKRLFQYRYTYCHTTQ